MGRSRQRLAVFALLMPFWIVLSSLVNTAGWLLDRLDRTETCYGNVMVRAVKP